LSLIKEHEEKNKRKIGSRIVEAAFEDNDAGDTIMLFNFNRSVADLSSSTHKKNDKK